jgi:hypothetical protein
MRLGKGFVLAVLFVLALASGVAAQPVSDSDFIYMVPNSVEINPVPASDSTFKWAVWVNNKTVLGAIALPVCYTGSTDLDIDTSVLTQPDIKGVTYGLAGRNAGWTIKASLPNLNNNEILCGFVSFSSFPATNDTLLYLHFKLLGGAADAVVTCDTCGAGGQHLAFTDVLAQDQIPTWTSGNLSMGTAVGEPGGITPLTYGLDQNLPNPFNAQTKINFSMPAPDHVKLVVFNVLGQQVVTLLDQKLEANKHEVVWDGNNAQGSPVASGTYFYRLKIGEAFEESRQMTLLK